MEHGQVVVGFFGPTNQQVAVAVEPGVGAFDDPAAGALPGLPGFCFFAPAPDMGRVAVGRDDFAHLLAIIARVQAQVLLGPGRRPRGSGLLHGGRLAHQCAFHQFHIVPVGPVKHQADGNALGLGLQAALGPALGPVGGVGAGFFPPRAAPCVANRRVHPIPSPGQ